MNTVQDKARFRVVSFVIPAWNEESVLGPTLEALDVARRRLAEPSEVIVADDSSTDRTADIARQRGAKVVSIHHRQISATRNAGAREATGDLLVFIDADTLVSPEALSAAVAAVRGAPLAAAAPFGTAGGFRFTCEFLSRSRSGLHKRCDWRSGASFSTRVRPSTPSAVSTPASTPPRR